MDDFDHKTLDTKGKSQKESVVISESEFLKVIDKMKSEFASDVFANPKDGSFATLKSACVSKQHKKSIHT